MSYFPMMVKLDGKKVLVIGGGEEGLKKTQIMHDFGAEICLISKGALKEAAKLASRYEEREFRDTDITDEAYDLIVAATDDRELNKRISGLAHENRIPVNIVDDEELCSFIFPAIIKDRDVVCAVSSGAKSPYITQYIKVLLCKLLPKNIGEINDRMGEYRKQAKRDLKEAAERRSFLKKKLEEELGTDIDLS